MSESEDVRWWVEKVRDAQKELTREEIEWAMIPFVLQGVQNLSSLQVSRVLRSVLSDEEWGKLNNAIRKFGDGAIEKFGHDFYSRSLEKLTDEKPYESDV